MFYFSPPVQKRAKESLQTKVRRGDAGSAANEAAVARLWRQQQQQLLVSWSRTTETNRHDVFVSLKSPRFDPGRRQSSMSSAGVIKKYQLWDLFHTSDQIWVWLVVLFRLWRKSRGTSWMFHSCDVLKGRHGEGCAVNWRIIRCGLSLESFNSAFNCGAYLSYSSSVVTRFLSLCVCVRVRARARV